MKKLIRATYLLLAISILACGEESSKEEASNQSDQNSMEPKIKDFDYYMTVIPKDKKWMVKVEKQAAERSISVDSMLTLSAKFMLNGVDGNDAKSEEKDVQFYIEKIKKNEKWLANVKKKAVERSISLDSMLLLSAKYAQKKDIKNKTGNSKELDHYIKKIKGDKKWMESIRKKAKERNVSVEEMIETDAKYTLKQNS